MAIKLFNPTTPAQRQMTSQDFAEITTKKPVKSLVKIKKGPPDAITKAGLLPGIAAVAFGVFIVSSNIA